MGVIALPFVLIPLLEIVVFVLVGERVGVWPLVGLIVLTGFAGAYIARSQGLAVWSQAQAALAAGRFPGKEMAHGAMVLAGAVLLVTPGFVTDGVGLLLMVPALRESLRRWARNRYSAGRSQQTGYDVIDI